MEQGANQQTDSGRQARQGDFVLQNKSSFSPMVILRSDPNVVTTRLLAEGGAANAGVKKSTKGLALARPRHKSTAVHRAGRSIYAIPVSLSIARC
jgi:hypothetical protein